MRVESKRRRRHRRRDHVRRLIRFGLTRVLPLLVLLVVLGEAWPHLRTWLSTVDALEVQRVRVAGNRLLTPRELIDIAEIAPGMSLLEVRPTACEERLIVHPRIRRARIRYIFPRDLRIQVEEREPVALLEMEGLHPLSADGVVLPSAPERVMESLPVVVPPRDLRWEGHLIQDESVLAGLAFLRALDQIDRRLTGSISVIDLTDARFAHVHLDTLSTALVFEIGGYWAAHVLALPAVVDDLTRSRLHGTVLDLRFREQIVRRGGTFAQLATDAG